MNPQGAKNPVRRPNSEWVERFEVVGAGGEPLIPQMTPEAQFEGARRLAFVLHRAGKLLAKAPPEPLQLTHQPLERVDLYGEPVGPAQ